MYLWWCEEWTAPLEELVKLDDSIAERKNVYSNPRQAMADIISKQLDFLSNSPLEVAYRWTLACSSVINEDLTFSNQTFKIKCEKVKVGRIFGGKASPINDDLIEKFQKNTLYYVQEGKGFKTHPLFDMYFLHTIDDTESKINIDDSESEIENQSWL